MKSLYNDLNRNWNRTNRPWLSGLKNQFEEFKRNFQGDPKAEVERLLQSDRISQADLDQLQKMAAELQQFIQ